MNMAADVRKIELPPVEGAPGKVEVEVRAFFAMQWDDAVDARAWRRIEAIILNGAHDVRAYGSGNEHRVGGADAVGEVNQLRAQVDNQGIRCEIVTGGVDARLKEDE